MIFQENGVKNRSLKLLKEKGAGGCPQEKKLFKKCKVDKKNKKKKKGKRLSGLIKIDMLIKINTLSREVSVWCLV